jgi:hypothetical protein
MAILKDAEHKVDVPLRQVKIFTECIISILYNNKFGTRFRNNSEK